MRLFLAVLLAFAGASSVSAQVVQDRYGPPRPRPAPVVMAALTPSAYSGRALVWSGKVTAPVPEASIAASTPAASIPAAAPPQPAAAARPLAAATPPQTPAPAPRVRMQPWNARLDAAPAPVQAAPIQTAMTAPPPAPVRAGAGPRFYSLHREYGRAPDAIPAQSAQPRYVLIGPPDSAAPAEADHGAHDTTLPGGMF